MITDKGKGLLLEAMSSGYSVGRVRADDPDCSSTSGPFTKAEAMSMAYKLVWDGEHTSVWVRESKTGAIVWSSQGEGRQR